LKMWGVKMARRRLRVTRKAYKRRGYKRRGFTVVRDGVVRMPAARVSPSRVGKSVFYIKDLGSVGRGKVVISKIRKGLLKRFGYAVGKSVEVRHAALRKADKKYGSIKLFKMLHAQVVLRKRTQPQIRKVFEADRDWVRENLLSHAERLRMTMPARRARW